MSRYVTDALHFWEPRIDVNKVELLLADLADDGGLLVEEIRYTIKATHDPRSIVIRFFIVDEQIAI